MSFSLDSIRDLTPSIPKLPGVARGLSVDKLREISFAAKYNFRVWFSPTTIPPFNFADELPVIDFEIEEAALETQTQEFFLSNYQYPVGSRARTLQMSFYDDEYHTLHTWIKNWINVDILNLGAFISCINDSHTRLKGAGRVQPARKIFIEKLNAKQEVINFDVYDIMPVGELTFSGSNASELLIHNMNFIIIRDHNYEPPDQNSGFINAASGVLDLTKQFGSRFF